MRTMLRRADSLLNSRGDGLIPTWWLVVFVLTHGLIAAALLTVHILPKPFGDGDYWTTAVAIARWLCTGRAASIEFVKGPMTPIYYLPVGVVGFLFGKAWMLWSARVYNLVLVTLSSVLLVKVFAGSRRHTLVLMALVLAVPAQVYYSMGILAEPPTYTAVCLCAIGWAGLVRFPMKRKYVLLLSAAMFCLGGLRPNLIPVGLVGAVLSLVALVLGRNSENHLLHRRLVVSGAAAFLGLVLLSTGLRATGLVNESFTRREVARALVAGRYQFRARWWDLRFFDEGARGENDPDLLAYRRALASMGRRQEWTVGGATQLVLSDLRAHPVTFLRVSALKALYSGMWVPLRVWGWIFGDAPPTKVVIAGLAVIWCSLWALLCWAPLVWLCRRGVSNLATTWPIWLPWAGVLAFVMLFGMEPRYVFPGKVAVVLCVSWLVPSLGPVLSGEHPTLLDSSQDLGK